MTGDLLEETSLTLFLVQHRYKQICMHTYMEHVHICVHFISLTRSFAASEMESKEIARRPFITNETEIKSGVQGTCGISTLHPPITFLPIFLTGSSSEDITIMTIGRVCVGEVLRAEQAQSLN